MVRPIAALAVGAVVLAGCGGASESEQVSSVVRRYHSAFAKGNASELCSLLTEQAKDELIEKLEAAVQNLGRPITVRTCPELVKYGHELLGQEKIAEIAKAKVTAVSISGGSATVNVTEISGPTQTKLRKTVAGWLISKLPEVSGATTRKQASPQTTGETTTEKQEGPSQ